MKLLERAEKSDIIDRIINEASGHALEPVLACIIEDNKPGSELTVYEVFVLANLSWFFNAGYTATNGYLDGIVNIDSNATSTEMSDYIRSLSADEINMLANELDYQVRIGNSPKPTTTAALNSTGMSTIEWIGYVLQRQD